MNINYKESLKVSMPRIKGLGGFPSPPILLGGRWKKNGTNLVNIDMAFRIKLRVVKREDGRVQLICSYDVWTCITELDNVDSWAILAITAEAEDLARHEVRAILVNVIIKRSQLEPTKAKEKRKKVKHWVKIGF